ncbi:MAG: hypothetical protein ACPGVU_03615 [Limisphaerales bacterium]
MLLVACGGETPKPTAKTVPNAVPKSAPKKAVELPDAKPLLMHYMPWYMTPEVRGKWGRHWTGMESQHDPEKKDSKGLPDIWSHYHPLIGLYDSTDPAVLECHLLQMKLAGVDGVVVDWYGISDYADYPQIHEAAQAMFAATAKYGMKFAACFEDRSVDLLVKRDQLKRDEVGDHLAKTFGWMQENWVSKANYFRLNGSPMILNFGPMFVREPDTWAVGFERLTEEPVFLGLHHLWKQAGADGGFTWVHKAPWDGPQDENVVLKRIEESFTYFSTNHTRHLASAYPGFNDVYKESYGKLDHRGGDVLRQTLQVALNGPWPGVQLVTWNDYGEGTMIEPTHEFGYQFLEIVQAARRKEMGTVFPFLPIDLRLPARLYALRKQDGVDASKLDAIATLLRDGRCAEARAQLQGAGGR